MFDLAWSEILVIGVVALVVIGPKDLPVLLRSVGQWIRKARSLASEFQSGIDQMARDAEIADLRKQVEQAKDLASGKIVETQNLIDPEGEIRRMLEASPVTPVPPPEFDPPTTPEGPELPQSDVPQTVVETAEPVIAAEEPTEPKPTRKRAKKETPPDSEEPTVG
ncbi:Sec-independent protein translocase protein TatB [Lacibacterium aquatile]|uniref:Sec-independent protein translocase protein TatB n=1 Tax=Lacibacterium aquatile TaxID=1168082 RepID=A0ABW5DNB6_9PROT